MCFLDFGNLCVNSTFTFLNIFELLEDKSAPKVIDDVLSNIFPLPSCMSPAWKKFP